MKQAILEFLRKKPTDSFSDRQIARQLELSSPHYKRLRQELRSLVKEGKIIVNREQHYQLRDESRVLKGTLKLHSEGFGFLVPEEKARVDVFIPRNGVNYAMNGDQVLVESYRNSRDGRYEGRVIQILARAAQTLVGTLKLLGDQYLVDLRSAKAGLDEIYIPKKNLGKANVGDFVAAKILQYPGPGIMSIGEIVNVIGIEVDEKTLKEAVLIQHGIPRKFPEAVHHDIEKLPAEVDDSLPPGRVDLRSLPIITIDGITAKDFDDAVCVEKRGKNYVLWVSIADVAEYVRVGSALDKEAYRRGTSTYLPDECVPMLPEKLSNGLCSLNPYLPRYTLTAEIHYNSNFDFTQALYYRSLIKSHKRATYDEVQAYYDGTGGQDFSPEIKKSLEHMKVLAEALIQRTASRGAMSFDLPEAEFVFDGRGSVARIKKRQRFFSHKLIEVFMIAANVAVAQYFSTKDLPLLYRIHDAPDSLKVQTFLSLATDVGLARLLNGFHPADFFKAVSGHRLETFLQSVFLRSLKQAVYSPANIGHYGLALKDYAHFTSPIRRYPDLTVHRQLRSVLDQSPGGVAKLDRSELKKDIRKVTLPTCYNEQDLVMMGQTTSKREREAMEAEREVTEIKRAFFMKAHMHEKFYGIVSRVNKFGLYIELDPHFVDGFLPLAELKDDYYIFDDKHIRLLGRRSKKTIGIGDRIYVVVNEIDSETSQIKLVLLPGAVKPAVKNVVKKAEYKPQRHKRREKK